jgi:hypothetical protein
MGNEREMGGEARSRVARAERESTGAEGELTCGGHRWALSGRVLRLMLWLAARQQPINAVAAESGQLWITWKGSGPRSITGEVKTQLTGE